MKTDLTHGPVMKTMLRFAVPMILGNLMQQCYNIADTLIVGQFLGAGALAAVGSAFSLMTFLTSILLGLAMGSGTVFSMRFGQKDALGLKEGILASFTLLGAVTVVLNVAVFLGIDWIIRVLQTPADLVGLMREYLIVIFAGLVGIFLYNFFASLLRSIGNSVVPLLFLAVSAVLNIVLDLWFVAGLNRGVAGAAEATVISQYVSGIGIAVYTWVKCPELIRKDKAVRLRWSRVREITSYSALTCLQQSIMNLGILAVQGLVNSFGTTVMAAFAAAVKIDAFAYLPVQDFGNAFSIFTAQNFGAGKTDRIRKGIRVATLTFHRRLRLCRAADDLVHRRGGDGRHRGGRSVSPHRGRVLLSDRRAVPALRAVPCARKARHVCCPYHRFARYPCSAGLCARADPAVRRCRNLVVGADRLASGGRAGPHLLFGKAENPAEGQQGRCKMKRFRGFEKGGGRYATVSASAPCRDSPSMAM